MVFFAAHFVVSTPFSVKTKSKNSNLISLQVFFGNFFFVQNFVLFFFVCRLYGYLTKRKRAKTIREQVELAAD